MTTIKDVAKHAGVSVSTVSLVLNNSPAVKHETRYRVLNSIKELRYQRNDYARSLVTKEKKIIGVVKLVDDTSTASSSFDKVVDTYITEMLRTIEVEIEKAGYSMLIEWDYHFSKKEPLPLIVAGNKVDGALLVGGFNMNMDAPKLLETKVPMVLVGARHDHFDYVDTASEQGIRMAMEFFFQNGHRDIAFVNGPNTSQSSERKMAGFLQAAQAQGMPYREEYVASGNFTGRDGYNAIRRIWESGARPTAVLAATDGMALGVMRYLHEKGIYCPKDISIIGFEDGLLAEYSVPPLTSVSVRKDTIGAEASKILINRIANSKAQLVRLVVEPKLVVRESVRNLA